ncbi:VOC family protein [uncultured Campylobacter sp.]|mgnify:CR=1 FL=1|uniref:VOC family protein n=1 Tax=uncultured Campylobacter sp. TaxID=218934 RepID=UPI0015AE578F|nr:VOC family protein [uncultured Campylobacter sp.]
MKITEIDHFVLVTEDLQKCVEFYEGILGLEHVCESGKHSLRFGSSKINIHTSAGALAPFAARPGAGSADFCLICEDQSAQQLKTELESKGAQIELGVVPRMGARGAMQSIYLRDPDGNLVELGVYERNED